jgi:ribosomal protein S18 acetylase RimI-like enzyme
MEIDYKEIDHNTYDVFHTLMTDYFRNGEDKDTPQEEIDAFIQLLFDKVTSGGISGRIAEMDQCAAGFVLWMKDTAGCDFSQLPGFGTILEIGITKQYQHKGIGKAMVAFTEKQLTLRGVDGLYVCAYGPAQDFWIKCGYQDSKRLASNGLPIFTKRV